MAQFIALFAEHGLLAVFSAVLVEQLGAPLPAVPFLLLAGAAAADDGVFAVKALFVATGAAMFADTLWFAAGRRYGRRVLGLLCQVSISPDSCVRSSELNFARRGVATLVVAKFVPGLSTLAPPLAGALGMRLPSFLLFNLAGTLLWAGASVAAGLVFHRQLDALLGWLADLGGVALIGLVALLALYVLARTWKRASEARRLARLPRIAPAELVARLGRAGAPLVVDVRAALTATELRIPGAVAVELAALEAAVGLPPPAEVLEIVTYCACPNDASALRAVQLLSARGYRVRALAGGIDAWSAAGYRLEAALEAV